MRICYRFFWDASTMIILYCLQHIFHKVNHLTIRANAAPIVKTSILTIILASKYWQFLHLSFQILNLFVIFHLFQFKGFLFSGELDLISLYDWLYSHFVFLLEMLPILGIFIGLFIFFGLTLMMTISRIVLMNYYMGVFIFNLWLRLRLESKRPVCIILGDLTNIKRANWFRGTNHFFHSIAVWERRKTIMECYNYK